MPSSAFGYLGLGLETTHGVSVPPTKFLPVKSNDFDIQQDEIVFREIAGSRQAQQSFGGSIRPTVTFDTAVYAGGGALGLLLKATFGSIASSALISPSTTAYKHTFADASVLPSLSFERSDTAGAGGLLHQRIAGCKIESMSFNAEFGAEVTLSVTAQGLSMPEDPASKPTVTIPIMDPFIFTGVEIDIDGSPNDLFKSIQFDFNNTLEPQESLRGQRTAFRIFEGPLECTLSGTMIFDDADLMDRFNDGSYFAASVSFSGSKADVTNNINYGLKFTWPRLKVLNFSVPMDAEGVMEADVEFSVSYDRSTGKFVTAELTNLDAGTVYNT